MRFSHPTPPPLSSQALTVTEVVSRIKSSVQINVGNCQVQGEVSNMRHQGSGHIYFTLKDDKAQIACALFKTRMYTPPTLKDGDKVLVHGEATVYEQRGQLQLIISRVEPQGRGDLHAQFLALKEKLKAEGLFEAEHKKALPSFPARIGIITSPTGAAMQDIRHILETRAPWVQVFLYPVLVQGDMAAAQLTRAITEWSHADQSGLPMVDTLILTRGGGSLEDMWCFNDENLARAIYSCPIPVISGVGHEIDFTIADFVADHRAPTPSAAAMVATPDKSELSNHLTQLKRRLTRAGATHIQDQNKTLSYLRRHHLFEKETVLSGFYQRRDDIQESLIDAIYQHLYNQRQRLEKYTLKLSSRTPGVLLQERKNTLHHLQEKLSFQFDKQIKKAYMKLDLIREQLKAADPINTLERGYSIVKDRDGKLIRSPKQVNVGDALTIITADGDITTEVTP